MTSHQLTLAAVAAAFACFGQAALAQSNPYQKGPDPTQASIEADGPYAVSTQTLKGSGFGSGTVYSPNTAGSYALVAVCPGFVSAQSSIAQISRRLATHGFVVVTIDTNTIFDFPDSRSTQLLAALKAAAALSTGPAAGKIDTARQAVAGWSMGGGGTLLAAGSTPALKGAVAYAPWALNNNLKANKVPAAILGGTADIVAPPELFSDVFYKAIPATSSKLLGIIKGADHFFPNTASQPASYTTVAWFKRFVDNDTRYSPFLNGDTRYSRFSSTGPF